MEILLGRKQAAKFLGLPPHQKILDVATGTGTLAYEFSKLGHSVIGIDSSIAMINRAEKKYSQQLFLRFEIADATHLPFKNHEFDVTSISFGLHDMPHETQVQVIKEMKRVTKPNGHTLIVDYNEPRKHLVAKLFFPLIRSIESDNFPSFAHRGLETILQEVGLKVSRNTTLWGLIQIAIIDC